MTDHPSTYKAVRTHQEGVQWDDRASIHEADDGQGVLDGAKGLRSGTLAQMVAQVMAYPPERRGDFVIQKAGDHRLKRAEIEALAARDDFPG
ncbi:hypothetical protein [Pelagerythrobacter marinus]|uniref:hypothetical protein n=1 Tax=Pelagerythrobacter marinus TaxID=538382 RepID=UPI002036F32C|nr:hypothetical protein [Pelagerythrobacter marinus]USA40892.1 hypothetical protein NCF86_07060 [Pelagerythrobacter marinus]WPZ07934.1 hypothetical protein T8T98_05290 [Pelagerythrobacter marinus]